MHRQHARVRGPDRNRRGAQQHAGVGREHQARQRADRIGDDRHQPRPARGGVETEHHQRDRQQHGRREERECPRPDRHGAAPLEDPQHVDEALGTAEIRDEQRWRDHRSGRGNPARVADQRDVGAGDGRHGRDHCRDTRHAADEEVRGYLPRPDRRLEQRPIVVPGASRAIGAPARRFVTKGIEARLPIGHWSDSTMF